MRPDSRGFSAGSLDSLPLSGLFEIGALTGTANLHESGRPSKWLLVGRFGYIRGSPVAPRTSKIG